MPKVIIVDASEIQVKYNPNSLNVIMIKSEIMALTYQRNLESSK